MEGCAPFDLPGYEWDSTKSRFFKSKTTQNNHSQKGRHSAPAKVRRRNITQSVPVQYPEPQRISELRQIRQTWQTPSRIQYRRIKSLLVCLRSDTKPLPWLLADPQRCSGFMAVLQGSDTIILLDGIYHFRTNVMIRNDELELLRITASKHPTLFATAAQTSEASMGDCWNLDYKDPSKNPVHDLRCLEVIEWIDRRTSVLVIIMGIGRSIQVLQVSLGYPRVLSYSQARLASDVMSIAAKFDKNRAILLVGTRSGRITRCYVEVRNRKKSNDRHAKAVVLNGEFCFVSAGAVYHLSFVGTTEFVAAYTNGDVRIYWLTKVVRGDASRLSDVPLCQYNGHKNTFRSDLASSSTNPQGVSIDPFFRLLALAGDDQLVRIWSLDSPEPIRGESGTLPTEKDIHSLLQAKFPSLVHALQWLSYPTDDKSSATHDSARFPIIRVCFGQCVYDYSIAPHT